MARRRTHSDEQILGAVRDLLLESGPRGVTTAAVSDRSGAPTGSLYHRFGSRSGMVAQLWITTIRDFHAQVLAAAAQAEPGMPRALATAGAVIDFATERPDDARLLTMASREQLRDEGSLPAELRGALETLNDPTRELVRQLTRELYGRATRSRADRVSLAVYGIPYTVVRHRLHQGATPQDLRDIALVAVRAVLEA